MNNSIASFTPCAVRARGYILIEGLIALSVVAAGLLGIARLQSAIVTASADAKATAGAYTVGRAKLEELRGTIQVGEHHGTACAQGTVVKTGNDTVPLGETTYTRSWNVQPLVNTNDDCRHKVTVTVNWNTREQSNKSIALTSIIAWRDPFASVRSIGAGGNGTGGGLSGKQSPAKFIDDSYQYEAKEVVQTAGHDGASIILSRAGEYILKVNNSAKIASTAPFVRLSGIVALDTQGDTKAETIIENVRVQRTDVTYCIFPLPFKDPDNPNTYGTRDGISTGLTNANDSAAAYVCYVPAGWRGNIGVIQRATNCTDKYDIFDGNSKIDSCTFTGDMACPGEQRGSALLSGVRSIKVYVRDADGKIVGASGVTPSHEQISMPNYDTLKQTWRLDFFIFKPKTTGNSKIETCQQRFPSVGSYVEGSTPSIYRIIRRINEYCDIGTCHATNSTGLEGVPSIVYTQHVLANDANYYKKITGTATGCTKVTATGTYPFGTVECSVASGNYTCSLNYGWKGTITASPNGLPASLSIDGLMVDLGGMGFNCNP